MSNITLGGANLKENKSIKVVYTLFIIFSALLISIPIIIKFTRTGTSGTLASDNFISIDNNWRLDVNDTKCLDFTKLGSYMDEDTSILNIYYKLPKHFNDTNLFYRSKDVYTKVYVDDDLLYETQVYESKLYNLSPGNIWNSVRIDDNYQGKTIRMEIKMVYDRNAVTIDHLYLGDELDIVTSYIKSKSSAIVISFLIICVGLSLLIMNIYEYISKHISGTGNFALAYYSVVIGIWSLCETNVLQFFITDIRIVQLIDNMMMFAGTLPMLFFIDAHYDLLRYRIIRIFCYSDLGLLLYCFFVQVTDISDFHHTIFLA